MTDALVRDATTNYLRLHEYDSLCVAEGIMNQTAFIPIGCEVSLGLG